MAVLADVESIMLFVQRRLVAALSIALGLLLACSAASCAHERLDTVQHASVNVRPEPYHLHLNGIGGLRSVDRYMLSGLEQGGLDAEVQEYDWCADDPGLGALFQQKRHLEQSQRVASIIEEAYRAQPGRRITLSAHSAGAGIIVWALEDLPADVTVNSLLLLSPALSPNYDLTKALRHVTGHIYVFYSKYDEVVLGLGTRLFGTVDGVKTDAAGRVGFKPPSGADCRQYAKLVQIPYQSSWIRLGNIGDHIGSMSRPFAREVIAPLLLEGKMPAEDLANRQEKPTTRSTNRMASATSRPAAVLSIPRDTGFQSTSAPDP